MVNADIPPEVWGCILFFLAKPIPPPLSNPPRSDLRQGDLTVAARVCKLFNSLSNTLLYTDIVTDDLPTLLNDVRTPSKRRLLSKTRSLRIEYCAKAPHPTYLELLSSSDDPWWLCGLEVEDKEGVQLAHCEVEVDDMTACMGELCRLGIKAVLPKLRTVAVASVYEQQPGLWMRHRARYPQSKDNGPPAPWYPSTTLFSEFLAGGRNVQHLCLRDPTSPLSLIPIMVTDDHKPSTYLSTVHFSARDQYIPLSPFGKTRWVSDVKSSASWADVIHGVAFALTGPLGMPDWSFAGAMDLEVYCSTSRYGPMDPAIGLVDEFGHGLPSAVLGGATEHGDRARRPDPAALSEGAEKPGLYQVAPLSRSSSLSSLRLRSASMRRYIYGIAGEAVLGCQSRAGKLQ